MIASYPIMFKCVPRIYLYKLLCIRSICTRRSRKEILIYRVCVCIPILVTTFPEWLGGTSPFASHTRRRASVLVVFVVFCVHVYSFAGLIRRTPPPTFSDTAITDRHSDTTIFQLRAHWVRISWSIESENRSDMCPRKDVPRVAQRYGTIAAHTRCRASVLVVFVVFCVHVYSFASLIRRTPPPTFSDTAITDRHSDTTIFQLRAPWVRISCSIGSEKSFGHVPPVGVEPSTSCVQGEHPIQ